MDSKQRHELETNDLRDFLDNFKDFWDRHGNTLLICFIVVVGGYAGWNYYKNWKTSKQEDASTALTGAASPDALRTVALDHELAYKQAMKRAGDLYHARARQHLVAGDADAAKEDLDKAANSYQALADATNSDLYKANAYLGLARVAESQEDWDAAQDYYEQAKQAAGQTHTILASQADRGLETLSALRHPHPFGQETAPPAPGSDLGGTPGTVPGVGLGGIPGLDAPALDDGIPDTIRRPENPVEESVPGATDEEAPSQTTNPGE